jgi:hypothetical protein
MTKTTAELISKSKEYIAKLQKDLIDFPFMAGMINEAIDFQTELLTSYEALLVTETKVLKKVGRTALGITKKVSITLPSHIWEVIEETSSNKSSFFRDLVTKSFLDNEVH